MDLENISYKIVIIGDSGVGKSSILLRINKNEFNKDKKVTVGIEFCTKKIEVSPNIFVKVI